MTDWQQPSQQPPQQPTQSGPIVMPAKPVEPAVVEKPRRGCLRIVVITLLVVALLTSGMLNLGLLARLGSAGFGVAYSGKLSEYKVSGSGTDKVAIVQISGLLMDAEGLFSQQGGYTFMVDQLEQAGKDSRVKAVILEVNSPGGGVTASDILAHRINKLGKEKTVVVCMKGVAASGGYYVSAGAHRIYAHPTTITGSIGVIYSSLNMKELMGKLGISANVIKSGHLKDFGSMFRDMTPEERRMIESVINNAFERFKGIVLEGRRDKGMTAEQVDAIATGGVFTAQQAKDLKLIDEIGYLEDAVDGARELAGLERARVIRYQVRKSSLMSLLTARFPHKLGTELTVRLDGMGPMLPAGLYDLWDGALMNGKR